MDAPKQARERLAFLDVARGVAALVVVAAHGLNSAVPGYLEWGLRNLELGRSGVVLFLIISGFIIPASLEQGGSLGKFWLRRFFRLFPAYWACMAAIALCWLLPCPLELPVPPARVGTWLLNLTMCQGFFGAADVNGVFWTLQLELVIYLACSLLFAIGLLRRVGWAVGMTAVLLFLPIGLFRPLFGGHPYVLNEYRFLYVLPLVGLVAQRYHAGRITPRRFFAFMIAQPLALVFVWGVNKALYPDSIALVSLWGWMCKWGVAYALFVALLEARRLPMPAAGTWLGRVSYSLYLFHPLVLVLLVAAHAPAWVLLPSLLAGSVAAAALAYHGVEEPGIRLGRAVERRLFGVTKRTPAVGTTAKAA